MCPTMKQLVAAHTIAQMDLALAIAKRDLEHAARFLEMIEKVQAVLMEAPCGQEKCSCPMSTIQ